MPIGACNPMACTIRAFRQLQAEKRAVNMGVGDGALDMCLAFVIYAMFIGAVSPHTYRRVCSF